MDYHLYDEALFVALTHGIIERYNITIMETDSGILEALSLQSPNPVEVYSAPSGNTLGDITIDWLHNTIYWIESTELSIQVRTSIYPSIFSSVHPSIYIYPSIHPSIHSSICPSLVFISCSLTCPDYCIYSSKDHSALCVMLMCNICV